MVAFRKMIPVLAMVALLLGTALTASAQTTPLRCTANAGVPPIVRAEGLTELTGDLVIECTGGDPTAAPFLANFQLFLNTNITSRIITSAGGSTVTEAVLMVDEPGLPRTNAAGGAGQSTPFCVSPATANNPTISTAPVPPGTGVSVACNPGSWETGFVPGQTYQAGTYTVFQGARPASGENILVWAGVPVQAPGSNRTRVFRITNVRANAAGLGASQTLIPTQIVAYVSVSPSGTLPIDNPQQTVGYVQQGMLFDVRDCAGGGITTPIAVNQCQGQFADWYNTPSRTNSSGFNAQFGLRFREGFQTAFKPRIQPNQGLSVPGQVFHAESGFVRTDVLGLAGIADTGTRLAARFVNVPANVRIFVATRDSSASSTPRAVLVTTDPNGASVYAVGGGGGTVVAPAQIAGPNTLVCGAISLPAIEVPLTSGSGVAVWEYQDLAGSATSDTLVFPVGFAYAANVAAGAPALGTGQVIGNLAPFYAAGTANTASASVAIPRFVARTDASNTFKINQCVTNLLFPYVTNWAGFDTGIAIANTSQDPFGSPNDRLNAGRCTINYYGTLANGNPPTTTSEQTDRDVAAGSTLTFILSGGGSYGLQGNPNFQGYIIAQCGFLYAHGFAFITDGPIGQARVAEGYLALVLDGADAGNLRGSSLGEVRGH